MAPVIEDLRRRTSRFGLEIILVNVWEGADARAEVLRFCELWDVTGPVLLDERSELAHKLMVRGVPTNVFVDSDGTVTAFGVTTPHGIEAATRDLLGPDVALAPPLSGEGRPGDQAPEHIVRHVTARNTSNGQGLDLPEGESGRSEGDF